MQMDVAAPAKRRALDECNQKDALLYVMTQEMRRTKMEMRRMEMKLALAEERIRICITHPMICETWVYPRNLPVERKYHTAAIDAIPDRADAIALVKFNCAGCPTSAEPGLEKLVGPMGPEAVWTARRPGETAFPHIEVPCSVVRRFLQTNNVWWYLPGYRDYKGSSVRVCLADADDQPMDVHEFSVYITHFQTKKRQRTS